MKIFDKNNKRLINQFDNIEWITDSGISPEELTKEYENLIEKTKNCSRAVIKAKTFEMILEKSRIALDVEDIFQDKIYGGNILERQRSLWEKEVLDTYMPEEKEEMSYSMNECGAYRAIGDYGHTSPNTRLLLKVGFPGLLNRVEEAKKKADLTPKQKDFYDSCSIVLNAIISFLKKLAAYIEPYSEENSIALKNIATKAPANIYEAMQLIIAYFFLHEYVAGTRVRTLGRLDVLLFPFYKNDIENKVYSKEEIKEMLKFFLNKFWSAKVPYDLPFCLGGMDTDCSEATNEISYLIVETYNELNIHSPKIHIRISDKTPESFVKLVLECIRGGNSSFVFVNDNVTVKALCNVGIEEEDARDYVPIGCYEPAVWGKEIGCTGNGGVNATKAVEFVMTRGVNYNTGRFVTIDTGVPQNFEEFIRAIKEQIKFMANRVMNYVRKIEKYYGIISPDPILSSMYDDSIERGIDVYEGGAKYNNSSIYCYCVASLVDSVMAVKKLVFEEKILTFEELTEILKNNWKDHEKLRRRVRNMPEKYGNNNAQADVIAKELIEYCSDITNNKPNGRGGVFKASSFSIDRYVFYGEKTMATPDGRYSGEPLSKNMSATVGMDRNGITGLINSVTKIDFTKFPNGTVLDIVLHPSTVQGEDGLAAFYSIIKTYINKGGFAIHGNVFDAETLKEAQKDPEKYATLQVRVCGWNAYFVKLSKAEQDCFIKQAESLV